MIRPLLVVLVTLTLPQPLRGQAIVDFGTSVPIAVRVPPTVSGIDEAVRVQLESRLAQLLTGTGLAAVPGGSNIVMYPSLVVTEETTVQGLRPTVVVKLDLTLFIKSVSDGVLFASISRAIGGSGRTRDRALVDAVSSLAGNDPALRRFAADGRTRILGYYTEHCDQVIAQGRVAAGAGELPRAMAVLLGVPMETRACRDRATAEARVLFAAHEEARCQAHVREARASLAIHDYAIAVAKVSLVDPASPCSHDADRLIAQMEREIDEREERALRIELERERARRAEIAQTLEAPKNVEARRIQLMEVQASMYFNQQPPPPIDPAIYTGRTEG